MATSHMKRWQIGAVEVIRIVEINAYEDELATLLAGTPRELIQRYDWLRPHFATPDGRIKISFQCFLVRSRGKQIMIDTCIGNGRERAIPVFHHLQSDFLADLQAAGADPREIDVVLCTHMHNDHVGWNTRLLEGKWVPTFPNARYLFSAPELAHWKAVRLVGEHPDTQHFPDSIDPIAAVGLIHAVETDYRITDEVQLLPTPGHTPGHVCVRITSGGAEALITGDMMHHPVQIAHPEMRAAFDVDPAQAALTRQTFVERHERSGALIIGTHFAHPTSGRIVRDGERWRLDVQQ